MEIIKSVFKSILGLIFFSFISGYLIGNYYATRAQANDAGLITPHNIISAFILQVKENPEAMKWKYKSYEN